MRTAFVIPSFPITDILQVVLKANYSQLPWFVYRYHDDAEAERAIMHHLESSQQTGFHLGVVPTRIALFEAPTSSVMVLQLHHSQYDGWSLPTILNDLQKAYESFEMFDTDVFGGSILPYSEFVRWSRQQSTPDALSYWLATLEDAALLSWPKVPHDASDIATDTLVSATWTPDALYDLGKFCSEHKATSSSLIRLALSMVLRMYGNSDDVLYGVVTSGRSGDLPGVETVVGPCITTLPFRLCLSLDASLETILSNIQALSSSAATFEYVGLSDIIKASPLSGSRNIFQVLLTVENIPELDFQGHPFFGEDVHGHQMEMNYPLSVTVFLLPQNQGFKVDVEYDSHYLTSQDIHWFKSHLFAALDAILSSPTSTLAELDIVTAEERAFLQRVGIGLTPDPVLASEPLMHRLFEKTATLYPERMAIEHTSGHTLTYAALDALSNRVARGLLARGVAHETPIPVLFNKDADQTDAVVAILAVMKAGAAFVPLDIAWPPARVLACVRQCASSFVICDADVARELGVPFATVAELAEGQHDRICVVKEQSPRSLAYVIFTSGSTGEPKGVMIEHRNIMGYVAK